MPPAAGLHIDTPRADDRTAWEALYRGFRDFYRLAENPQAIDTVWGWVVRPGGPLEGRVARTDAGALVALMHFREVPRPFHGVMGGYLDELFIADSARGEGIADAMMDALHAIGVERGWRDVRWITSDSNARSCAFYDRVSKRTKFVTYEIRF
ncbi:MAG: GNAT family N-acetyltransferase [Rhodospirillaceae bacterium]